VFIPRYTNTSYELYSRTITSNKTGAHRIITRRGLEVKICLLLRVIAVSDDCSVSAELLDEAGVVSSAPLTPVADELGRDTSSSNCLSLSRTVRLRSNRDEAGNETGNIYGERQC
jgi:hypothetical protein